MEHSSVQMHNDVTILCVCMCVKMYVLYAFIYVCTLACIFSCMCACLRVHIGVYPGGVWGARPPGFGISLGVAGFPGNIIISYAHTGI